MPGRTHEPDQSLASGSYVMHPVPAKGVAGAAEVSWLLPASIGAALDRVRSAYPARSRTR